MIWFVPHASSGVVLTSRGSALRSSSNGFVVVNIRSESESWKRGGWEVAVKRSNTLLARYLILYDNNFTQIGDEIPTGIQITFFCKYCKFAFRIIVCKYCKKPFQTIFCKLFLWTTLFCVQILHIIIPYYFFLHVIFRILLSSYKVVTKMIMANLIYERILWEITSAIVPKTKVRQSNINLNAFKLNGAKL